jgi:ubiquinone/menaquinone biosynthesis C-methylase UbiE
MGTTPSSRPDYGLDAPGVVRNLALAGTAGLLVWLSAAVGLWSGVVAHVGLAPMGAGVAVGCLGMAAYMVWSSKVGKVRRRERLLDLLPWTGGERVLDVGCGRGLMLVGAARRLTTGKAVGIDIWQAEDLAGNRPEAPLENARREGVADRVEVHTADMRQLPFPDAGFDAVVSSVAIHNLYDPKERARALGEIARVLKPGGRVLIDDIRHFGEYAAALAGHGLTDLRRASPQWMTVFFAAVTMGSLRPATLVGRKPGSA